MKYAIVEDGSKQYKAIEGKTIDVDFFKAEIGEQVDLPNILFIKDDDNVIIGTPTIDGAKVAATVVDQVKGKKIVIFKYRPKQRYRVKTGHRQKYTRLQINEIKMD